MKLQKLFYLPVIILAIFSSTSISIAQTDLTPYQGNPILTYGSPGSWDAGWVAISKTVLHDSLYYIFYEGSPDVMTNPIAIGYATSPDGMNFTKYELNPVLESDGTGFDAFFVAEPVPLIEGNTWVLYYNASSSPRPGPGDAIGRATANSPNGPWTRNENAVLEVGNSGEWDSGLITPNSVIATDSGYVMYYSASSGLSTEGKPAMEGMATSPDGITWTKYNDPTTIDPPYADSDPVLPLGVSGSWDSGFAWEGSVWQTASGWEMYYSGVPENFATEQIGFATSIDGINWIKYEGNPILGPTEPWARLWVIAGSVILIDSTYFLYYTGFSSFTSAQIGLAADFKNNPYSIKIIVDPSYASPGADEININAEIVNKENRSVTVRAIIDSDDKSVADSVNLTSVGNNIWSGIWLPPNVETNYIVSVKTIDQNSGNIHNGLSWGVYDEFTTKGPLVIDAVNITSSDTIVNPGDRIKFDLTLKNLGVTDTVYNVDVNIIIPQNSCALETTFGTPTFGDLAPGESLTNSSGSFAISFADSCNPGQMYNFILEISSNGEVFWYDNFSFNIVTGIIEESKTVLKAFTLNQNFPNPFNPSTTIEFSIPESGWVTLKVYDLSGSEVTTLVSENLSAGTYKYNWKPSGLASGIYFYKIIAERFIETKKMTLIK